MKPEESRFTNGQTQDYVRQHAGIIICDQKYQVHKE
jgi:hypothetical protein